MTNRVLFVDDEQNVLDGIRRALRKDVDLEIAVGGEEGLRILREAGPFAVVVSDMRMPNMSGPQFLAKVRELSPDTVRMVLSGQAEMESTIAAVNDGHIYRFMTKPCEPEQLLAAVEAGLRQYRLITGERELLEKTLGGAVRMLTEILGITNPPAYSRASRIQRYAEHISASLNVEHHWQLRLAAMLSQIGCVALPPDTIAKMYAGETLTAEEDKLYRAHPDLAGRLLAEIPRMEDVAAIVASQAEAAGHKNPPDGLEKWDVVALGRVILRGACEFDRLLTSGMKPALALDALRAPALALPPQVIEALRQVPAVGGQTVTRLLNLQDLAPGMVVDQDVLSTKGLRLVPQGQAVTRTLLERLRSVAAGVGVVEPFRVQIPG